MAESQVDLSVSLGPLALRNPVVAASGTVSYGEELRSAMDWGGVGGIIENLGPRELIYGIDIEPDVLGYAARRFRHRPECRFGAADIAALPPGLRAELQQARFDSVICINVLEHVRDDVRALRAIESVLAPNGTLALLVPAHRSPWHP